MVLQTLKNLLTRSGWRSYPSSHRDKTHFLLGIGFVVFTYLLLACTNSLAKSLSQRIHPFETVFFQSALSILLLIPYLIGKDLRPKAFSLHLVRDISGCLAFSFTFMASTSVSIVDASLLHSANALWVPLILLVWFHQKIPVNLLLCLCLGFIGVILVLKPMGSLFQLGSLWGVGAGLSMAIAMVSLRVLSQKEPFHRIIFFFCLVSTILGALALPFVWVTPTLPEFGLLFLNALSMVATQFLLTYAYSWVPASRLSPFAYTVVLWAGLVDWLVWDQLPGLISLIGAILIISSALYSISIKTDRALT